MKKFWLINLCLFQASWYTAALLTDYATVVILGLLLLHFALSPSSKADFRLLLLLPIGILADALQIRMIGSFSGTAAASIAGFPLWLLYLWAMLLVSLNHSLSGLEKLSLPLLALVGAVAGAGSYYAGVELGALQTSWSSVAFLGMTGAVWAGLLPALVFGRRLLLRQTKPAGCTAGGER